MIGLMLDQFDRILIVFFSFRFNGSVADANYVVFPPMFLTFGMVTRKTPSQNSAFI